MKKMKKLLCITLSALLMLSIFTACSSQETPGSQASAGSSASAGAPADDKPVDIEMLNWRFSESTFAPVYEAFQKEHPNINITLTSSQNVEQYLNMQKVRMLSGDGIDFTAVRMESYQDYIDAGYLLNVSDQPFVENISESFLKDITVDGELYGLPVGVDAIGVFYNKDIFEELGLEIPTNWDEFLAVCEAIKNAGYTPLINGGKDGWPMEFDVYAYIQDLFVKNPDIFEKIAAKEAKYTDDIFVEAFTKIEEFYKLGYIGKETLSIGNSGALTMFRQGKSAMMIQGQWALISLESETDPAQFDIGVFPLPYNEPGEEIVVPVEVAGVNCVYAKSKNMDAALTVLEWMSSVEGSELIANTTKTFSPVKGAKAEFSKYASEWTPLLEMPTNRFFYSLQSPGANAEMVKGLQMLFLGETTPMQVLENMQAEEDKIA